MRRPAFLSYNSMHLPLLLLLILSLCAHTFAQSFSATGSSSGSTGTPTTSVNSEYYLSELEYKLIELNDYMLDYEFSSYTSTCSADDIEIESQQNDMYNIYSEDNLQSPLKSMIVFANSQMLKVNAVGLLANATLVTFIDDASNINSYNSDSTNQQQQLASLRSFPINNADQCDNLKKINSTSFVFECSQIIANSDYRTVTLYAYTSPSYGFSNATGIDLTVVTPIQTILTFDPLTVVSVVSNQSSSNLLSEYYDCVKETNYYLSSDGKFANYFRYCKYHETTQKLKRNGELRQFANITSNFFEIYSIPHNASTTTTTTTTTAGQTTIAGTSPYIHFVNFTFFVQGALQFSDNFFCALDFNDGLLFFIKDPVSQLYTSINFFVKYFYDQKYLNVFIQKNIDPEFSIQTSIPDYLIVNTQSYIISYALQYTVTGSTDQTSCLDQYPTTVSVARLVEAVKTIHQNNQQESNVSNNDELFPDIMDVSTFRSIRYDFDQYLYYIQIKYVNQANTYHLLINRALTDTSNDINMNPQAIEVDRLSSSAYSKLFHYQIPGLFYSNIRSRVRLFEATTYDDIEDGIIENTSIDESPNSKVLSVRTYTWKSPATLNLYTQQFDSIQGCEIQLTFSAKPFSKAVGSKQQNVSIHLIPRNFSGVISKQGPEIALSFENPKPFFEIKDWFFGPAVQYTYNPVGSSPTAQMNLIYSSTTTVVDASSSSSSSSSSSNRLLDGSVDTTTTTTTGETAEETVCSQGICTAKLISAVQVQNSYYIFHQNCACMFWFEKCTLTDKRKSFKSPSDSSAKNSTNALPLPTSSCTKSLAVNITANADKVLFDGTNILVSQHSADATNSSNTTTTTTTTKKANASKALTAKVGKIIYMKVDQITPTTYINSTTVIDDTTSNARLLASGLPSSNTTTSPSSPNSDELVDLSIRQVRKGLPALVTLQNPFDNSSSFDSSNDENTFESSAQNELDNETSPRTASLNVNRIKITAPQSINVGNTGLDDMRVYSIPNTNKYSVITQSQTLKVRMLCIFSLDNAAKDISFYTFSNSTDFQDSYDVSLLDQGILFASSNAKDGDSSGRVTVYKVNFVAKTITVDRVFTQSDMINQIQEQSYENFKSIQKNNSNNTSEAAAAAARLLHSNEGSEYNLQSNSHTNNDSPVNFMNEFAVKIWRNDESKTYRLLVIDYLNNCVFDYFLYDLIRPVYIRQVNLYNYTISANQTFQITNNMMSVHVEKDSLNYLIALDITGESINQIKSVSLQEDTKNFSQVQSSLGTPYEEGSLCGVYTSPTQVIECIFNPFIQLSFDFSTTATNNANSTSDDQNRLLWTQQQQNEDNRVAFSVGVSTNMQPLVKPIILKTNFSNFDTRLVSNEVKNQVISYNVTSADLIGNDTKMKKSALDTSFVSGSIENYYIQNRSSSNVVSLEGYINTNAVRKSVLQLDLTEEINQSDRNPYQLVGLANTKIIVINQNLNFAFDSIYEINYADISVRKQDIVPIDGTNDTINNNNNNNNNINGTTSSSDQQAYNYKVVKCDSIYSNQIESSASTSTYRYLLKCDMTFNGLPLASQQYITFTVDVNPFSSLNDQAKDWKRAMRLNVQLVEITFFEERLQYLIGDIKYISILSLTDSNNNIGGYIFLMVREIQEPQNNSPGDNSIYILWSPNSPLSRTFQLQEIDQINSSDLDLNNIAVKNFVANFPSTYPNQSHLDINNPSDFTFNIANYEESVNQKEVFASKYQDIYSSDFDSFIKPTETWTNPLTPLKSTITFHSSDYNANVLITNEFSIIEFQVYLSPENALSHSSLSSMTAETTMPLNSPQPQRLSSQNILNKILIYTQYAWCENQFSNDQVKQQILKYDSFLVIQCQSAVQPTTLTKQFILKVYKILDCDSSIEDNTEIDAGAANKRDISTTAESMTDADTEIPSQTNTTKMSNVKYSMVQSIEFESGQSIDFMSFRTENLDIYLDLIVNSFIDNNYVLHQYPVNQKPVLVYPANVTDGEQITVCVNNRYTSSLCSTAVLSNVIIDMRDQSIREWAKFIGLVCVPCFITISMILAAFLSMKGLRKRRQDEFIELLMGNSSIKSNQDVSVIIGGDAVDREAQKNQNQSTNVIDQLNSNHSNHGDADYFDFDNKQMTISELAIKEYNNSKHNLRNSFSVPLKR